MLIRLGEHVAEAGLKFLVDSGVPALIHLILPLMTRAQHRLHLIDLSRQVDAKSLDDERKEVHSGGTMV